MVVRGFARAAVWHKNDNFADMELLKKIGRGLRYLSFLKYVVVVGVGVMLVGFMGENSVASHLANKERMEGLDAEIDKYRRQNARNMRWLERLETDPVATEEVARARYFMKRDDEDIFVLSDDKEQLKTNDYETAE